LKSEYDEAAAKIEGALQEALSEISSCMTQIDEQSALRERFERRTRELERHLAAEKQRNKLAEIKANQKQWRLETNHLIASIQEECNSVFLRKIQESPIDTSPRTVVVLDDDVDCDEYESAAYTDPGVLSDIKPLFRPIAKRTLSVKHTNSDYFLQSPTQVNKTLEETEAIVMSLLGDDFQ
jgi:hypothetical protein